jgi:hypothetical protein
VQKRHLTQCPCLPAKTLHQQTAARGAAAAAFPTQRLVPLLLLLLRLALVLPRGLDLDLHQQLVCNNPNQCLRLPAETSPQQMAASGATAATFPTQRLVPLLLLLLRLRLAVVLPCGLELRMALMTLNL